MWVAIKFPECLQNIEKIAVAKIGCSSDCNKYSCVALIQITILVQLVPDVDFVQQKLNKDSFGCEPAKELSE